MTHYTSLAAAQRLKLLAALGTALAFLSFAGADLRAAAKDGGLTAQEKRGKEIYLKGADGKAPEILALLGNSDLELPGSSFACANCHGRRGEGSREGGLTPPPIDWKTLTSLHTSALTGVTRKAYSESTLVRAITAGVNPDNVRLHPGMPVYRMSAEQMSALSAYLKKIGLDDDLDPGVSDTSITIGAALPLSGPLAQVGEDVRAVLAAYFDEVNANGGIYNRKFELVVEDSQGTAEGTAATRRLVEERGVFALAGSFEPQHSEAANSFLAEVEVPFVGPATLSPRLSVPPNRFVFYLLPTFEDQARVLVDYVHQTADRSGTRLAVISSSGDYDNDSLAGLKSQARLYDMEFVLEETYRTGEFAPAALVEQLRAKRPDYVCFFGSGSDFLLLAREAERAGLSVPLLSSAVMLGRDVFETPASTAPRVFLSYPAPLPDEHGFEEFLRLLIKSHVPLRNSAFQRSASAAAKILVAATKRSSRFLSRARLVEALEEMRDFETGVIPAVSFGPNRRVGAAGGLVMGLDEKNKRYVLLSSWMEPKDRP